MAEISRDPKMLRRRPNNAVTPETPVFLLHLYDRAILNAAALHAVGYTKDTPNPPGGEIVRGPDGTPTGLLLAKPKRAASGHAATTPQTSVTALVTFLLSALLSHISAGRGR